MNEFCQSTKQSYLSIMSYNSRGLSALRKSYVQVLLNKCDVLFLQEHWLSADQLSCLNTLSSSHANIGVSGFGSSRVLQGRPYGGCSILWRQGMCDTVSCVDTCSNRVCAICCSFTFGKILFINAYMPCDTDESRRIEFIQELSVVESIIASNTDALVVFGGDFNVDFTRDWPNTRVLADFCQRFNLCSVNTHSSNTIDYTYNFNMQYFHVLDHILVSELLYNEAVCSAEVCHDIDNTSDHDPVRVNLRIDCNVYNVYGRNFVPRIAWHKATPDDLAAYSNSLRDMLAVLSIPSDVISCHDTHCTNAEHIIQLQAYYRALCLSLTTVADRTLPHTSKKAAAGRIPGWNEYVKNARESSLFWHDIWTQCGKPRDGVVADVMRRARASYHYAIRFVKRNENNIVNEHLAEALVNNRGRDFWREVKHIRGTNKCCSSYIDGIHGSKDIAELFADQYQDLFCSVSYDNNEMSRIYSEISCSLGTYSAEECIVNTKDVFNAASKLKPGKSDGRCLSSDHFIHACDDLYVHIALLFTGLVIHGYVPDDFSSCAIIPIPKGKQANVTDSGNYRGIALCSIFTKIFDLIMLSRFCDHLHSSELQFGFKARRSTDMCTMVLKETIAYYINNGSPVYCSFLDASKAFDRIEYCKLFRMLMKRQLPFVVLRFLMNMYVKSSARIKWDDIFSGVFNISNGVKQGGVLSPFLFCIYIDDLLSSISETHLGCHIGNIYVGVLAYADDIVLLAPTPSAMRKMLSVCDSYAANFNITFNPSKSKCILFPPKNCVRSTFQVLPVFYIGGSAMEFVRQYSHLGHILSDDFDDASDINRGRVKLISQINSVLCYFCKVDCFVRMRLLTTYCYSLYGCVLWDFVHPDLNRVCTAWRVGVRRAWNLPYRTHSNLLPLISLQLPLVDEVAKRTLEFSRKCLSSDSKLVSCVAYHALLSACMISPFARNVFNCCSYFNTSTCNLWHLTPAYILKLYNGNIDVHTLCKARMLLELLSVRSGASGFTSETIHNDLDTFIDFIATVN